MASGSYTGNTQMAGLIAESIRRKFVPRLKNKLRFDPWCAPGKLDVRGGSKVLRWNIMSDIGTFTTALDETTTTQNEVLTITVSSVLMTVSDYGAFVKISDLADSAWTAETREEHSDIFSYAGAKTKDTLERNAALLTTKYVVAQKTTANSGTLFATGTAIAQDLNTIRGWFDQNDCEPFDDAGGNYALIIHGKVEQDMVADVTNTRLSWSPLLQYTEGNANKYMAYKGPGTLLGMAVQRSNNLTQIVCTVSSTPPSNSGSVTAYACIAMASFGMGKTTLDQAEPRIIMKRPGPSTVSVPLDTYGTMGFKLRMAQSVLDVTRVVTYYAAV